MINREQMRVEKDKHASSNKSEKQNNGTDFESQFLGEQEMHNQSWSKVPRKHTKTRKDIPKIMSTHQTKRKKIS